MMIFMKRILRVTLLVGLVGTFSGACDNEGDEDPVPAPTIESFFPAKGVAGSKVTITGTNFRPSTVENIVNFNGTSAKVNSATTTSLIVTVPAGATSGRITIAHSGQLATSTTDFTVRDCNVDCGPIEKFILTNGVATFEPINFSKFEYDQSAETSRGIVFTTTKRIRITAIGGLFGKVGQYGMTLANPGSSLQYMTSVTAQNNLEFAYADVTSDFIVEPYTPHVLFYCDSNHESVYDFWLPGDSGQLALPYAFDDIEVDWLYYSYANECGEAVIGYDGFKRERLLLRGIVDLHYELVE
jgi:hypothetical protein